MVSQDTRQKGKEEPLRQRAGERISGQIGCQRPTGQYVALSSVQEDSEGEEYCWESFIDRIGQQIFWLQPVRRYSG